MNRRSAVVAVVSLTVLVVTALAVPAGGADDDVQPADANEAPVGAGSAIGGMLSAHSDHTCAVVDSGAVLCVGENDDGETGAGSIVTPQLAPVTVPLGGTASAVAAGDDHTCALLTTGTVRCWGLNADGQTGTGNVVTPQLAPVTVPLGGTASA
ncbi:MAG: RCC1 domain-containing protein, partial [Acidimicrobiia bacterium]|nr:RCC1 domain-containing protein [Acidimicrobiia bacterium]